MSELKVYHKDIDRASAYPGKESYVYKYTKIEGNGAADIAKEVSLSVSNGYTKTGSNGPHVVDKNKLALNLYLTFPKQIKDEEGFLAALEQAITDNGKEERSSSLKCQLKLNVASQHVLSITAGNIPKDEVLPFIRAAQFLYDRKMMAHEVLFDTRDLIRTIRHPNEITHER